MRLLVFLLLLSFPGTLFSRGLVVKFVHFAPPTHPIYKAVDFFKKAVESRTGGEVRVVNGGFKLFGDEVEKLKGVIEGRFQMCIVTTSLLANKVPGFLICDMPFLWPSREELYKALDGPIADTLSQKLEKFGLVLLSWCENDFREFINRKRPIHRPIDMSGLKIRTLNSELYTDMYRYLGAEPVNMPFSKILQAIKKGEIDGIDLPVPVSFISGFIGYSEYITVSNWSYMGCAVLANEAWFNRIPKDVREAVSEAAYEMGVVSRSLSTMEMLDALEKSEDAGAEVNWLTDDEKRLFRMALKKFYKKWAVRIGKDFFYEIWDYLGYPKPSGTSP